MSSHDLNPAAVVGTNIDRLMRGRHLERDSLAAEAGIDSSALAKIIRGEQEPDSEALIRIAGVLGVDVGALFEGIRWTPDGGYRVEDPEGD